jgi:anti-anti-sigma factor
MDIRVSFEAGLPVVTLDGRFDGAGAIAFDAQMLALDTDAVHWVIDVSGVCYLASLGIGSLVALEKRLKARNGGLVLAGTTPFVQQVLHVTRLDEVLRIAPNAATAIETARTSGAPHPTTEITLSRWRAKVRRLPIGESTIEWWSPAASPGSRDRLLHINASDLGIAFGVGVLGDEAGVAGLPGHFVCTPQFAGMVAERITDFIVGDASRLVPIGVASALGLSGAPAAIVELEGSNAFSIFDVLDEIFDRVVDSPAPATLGFVALAHTQGTHPGLYAAGVAFNPLTTSTTIDPEKRLEALPGQLGLPSGRRVVGGAVTLAHRPAFDGSTDIRDALSGEATLDALGGIIALAECAPVMKIVVWVFTPRELRNGVDKLLQVTVEGSGDWRPEWDAIVRHLYHDCRSVTLTPLHGGFMSSTFKAVAYDHDGRRTLPSVVKIGPTALTQREQQAHHDYVSRFILNNGTTLLGDARHGDWAGLRYNFLGVNGPDSRLTWLYDQYHQRPVPEVMALFERLFTRVLKPWYAQPKWEPVFLFRDHTPLRLFPSVLETAEQLLGISADSPDFDCHELGVRLPNPFRFLKYEYPRRASESRLWYTAICHGDLNLRNVLVDERDNLYVIDFSETRPRNAVSDFARLEAVLKFEMTRVDNDEDLQRLVEFDEALTSVTALDQPAPFCYRGDDPLVARAHAGIALLRRCADRATLFEVDIVPYWLALLEWTYATVCYRQMSARHKRCAACSAALICRSILQLEGGA